MDGLARYSAALAAGKDAVGADELVAGAGFGEHLDLLLALGWPHLRFLVRGHPDDEVGSDVARAMLVAPERPGLLTFPEKVAFRACRLVAQRSSYALLTDPSHAEGVPDHPIEADEVPLLLAQLLRQGAANQFLVCELVYLLEAMHGPKLVAEHLLDALSEGVPMRIAYPDALVEALGYLMLRMPLHRHVATKERVLALHRTRVAEGHGRDTWVCRLGLLQGGIKPVRASGRDRNGRYPPGWIGLVHDAPAFIVEQLRLARLGKSSWPDARLAFLGGPAARRVYAERWAEYLEPSAQAWLARTFAVFADDALQPMYLALAAGDGVASGLAHDYFRDRPEHHRPFLEAEAAAAPSGVAAAILREMEI